MRTIQVTCKNEKLTTRDLSEFLYNLDVIYTLLALEKREQEVTQFYFRKKLPQEEALKISFISMKSPLVLGLSSVDWETLRNLATIIALTRAAWETYVMLKSKGRQETLKRCVIEELKRTHLQVKFSEVFALEITKLSKRTIKPERVEEIKR